MKLFKSGNKHKRIENCDTTVQTPLGNTSFGIRLNDEDLSNIFTKETYYRLANGGMSICYYHSDFLAELVICEPSINIPANMNVEKVFGAVWRVKALVDHFRCDFYGRLNPIDAIEVDGHPDSGEGLDAITWDYDKYRLTLGTEDGPSLVQRAKIKRLMPDRFNIKDEIAQHAIVEYLQNGLLVQIPELPKNECCQVHFVLAWNQSEGFDDNSTWFAVDMKAENILGTEFLS